jgi:hypothetical protein
MERFFCLDCNVTGYLNQHGRCATCNSNSVVFGESQQEFRANIQVYEITELKRMFAL